MPGTPKPRPVSFCECHSHAFVRTSSYGIAIVDREDASLLSRNAVSLKITGRKKRRQAYAAIKEKYLHRLIIDAERIDHINGNGLDCRRSNLRLASRKQNARNCFRHTDAVGRYKGVYPLPSGRWNAKIAVDELRINLGTFDTEIEGAQAYDQAARRYFGKFSRLNFPAKGENRA